MSIDPIEIGMSRSYTIESHYLPNWASEINLRGIKIVNSCTIVCELERKLKGKIMRNKNTMSGDSPIQKKPDSWHKKTMVRYLESRVELSLCERRSGVFRTALTGSSQLPPADRCSSAKTKQKK